MFAFFVNLFLLVCSGNSYWGSSLSYNNTTYDYRFMFSRLSYGFFTSIFNMFGEATNYNLEFTDSTYYIGTSSVSFVEFYIGCIFSLICCVTVTLLIVKAIKSVFKVFTNWF